MAKRDRGSKEPICGRCGSTKEVSWVTRFCLLWVGDPPPCPTPKVGFYICAGCDEETWTPVPAPDYRRGEILIVDWIQLRPENQLTEAGEMILS